MTILGNKKKHSAESKWEYSIGVKYEPLRGKTNKVVSEQVQHK